jgi:CBS domain-containing protein
MKKVKHYMRSDVLFVRPDFSVFDVAKVFSKNHISGAPVVERGRVTGMISISDITKFMSIRLVQSDVLSDLITHDPSSMSIMLLALVKMGKDYADFKKELERMSHFRVKDMMSRTVVAVSPDAPLFEAAGLMDRYDVNRLPVIERNKLIGIITRADLLRALID